MNVVGSPTEFHVTPYRDLKPHQERGDCWCKPVEREPGLFIHNSMDGREFTIEKGVVQ